MSNKNILLRKDLEKKEKLFLKPYSSLSSNSKGRQCPEEKNVFRLCFQRDRDRIIHSKAFRRLKAKTQVFTSSYGDHYRTRLTHTLEVAQISRGISRTLGLNEDLAEAIALAHDLGHTPFGHAGEDALNEIMSKFNLSFEHNEQSKRIVQFLEKDYPDFDGLNLSYEVIEGLMKHQTPWDQKELGKKGNYPIRPSLEAEVVNLADEIAYQSHDIDDGLRANFFDFKDLSKIPLFLEAKKQIDQTYKKEIPKDILKSRIISLIINYMIQDAVSETAKKIEKYKIKDQKSLKACSKQIVSFSPKMREKSNNLRMFLFNNFYMQKKVYSQMKTGKKIIKSVFNYYFKNFNKVPSEFYQKSKNLSEKEKAIIVKDYIAGMTDDFVRKENLEL